MKLLTIKTTKIAAACLLSMGLVTSAMSATVPVAKDRVEYIWPEVQQSVDQEAYIAGMTQALSSDEYWETVTGAQLQKGVRLFIENDALVRVAPKATYSSGARLIPESLNMNALSIRGAEDFGSTKQGRSLQEAASKTANSDVQITQLASQADMEAAGFFDGSVALQVSNPSSQAIVMTSGQAFSAKSTYLIHVKEKSSPNKLKVDAPRFWQQNDAGYSMEAAIGKNKPVSLTTKVTLVSPDGRESAARYLNGQVFFDEPLYNVGAYKGFYEVQLTTLISVDGKLVKRSVKVPFVNMQKTAEMTGLSMKKDAHVSLNVTEPGRYNITATLQGLDANGQWQKLQTADVAQWAEGETKVRLPFKLDNFASYKKLKVVDVKLMDQSRLMPLQYEATF